MNVGVVGCGNISGIYFENLTNVFKNVNVISCSDLIEQRSAQASEKYKIPKVYTTPELMKDSEVDIVLNLTTPGTHYDVCMQALEAGKHIYVEKPLSLTREQGKKLLGTAERRGLKIGCAPDTFLGGGIQTCAKLIRDGWIGEPVAGTAFMTCHGHEGWHPDPEFYYDIGGGPMFDMGPYYLTALVSLIGGVSSVSAMTKTTFPTRTITSEKKFGKEIEVKVPTHIAGLMEFDNGAVVTIITSFDIWAANLPRIEIYGTEGSLSVPDPNTFGGPVLVRRSNHSEWQEIPLTHIYNENSRGIGVSDLAASIEQGRENRANGKLSYHVLDIMHAFHDSAMEKKQIAIESKCKSSALLSSNLIKGYV